MLNISSKTKSHTLVLIFGPHVPLWLPSIVTLHLWKEKMSFSGETWYMGRMYEEVKNYTCIWLISICIIN